MHTYLRVNSIFSTQVSGLQGRKYLDQLSGPSTALHTESDEYVSIECEVDRIMLAPNGSHHKASSKDPVIDDVDSDNDVIICDNRKPSTYVEKRVRLSTPATDCDEPDLISALPCDVVFWNAWDKKCERLPDMDNKAYESYVCIEPAAGIHKPISLAVGNTLHLEQTLRKAHEECVVDFDDNGASTKLQNEDDGRRHDL